MRVLMICGPDISLDQPFVGGTETFVDSLSSTLIDLGVSVTVFARELDSKKPYKILGPTQDIVNIEDSMYSLSSSKKLQQFMSFFAELSEEYDVLHFNSYSPFAYRFGWLCNVPSIVTLHTHPHPRFVETMELFEHSAARSHFVGVSDYLSQSWAKHLTSRPQTILNGVDSRFWTLDDTRPCGSALWVGRIVEDKDPVAAIHLAKELGKDLILAGPIRDRSYFERSVQPLLSDSIRYIGHLDHDALLSQYRQASLLLSTSRWTEPFGLTNLEALMCGTPVIGYSRSVETSLQSRPGVAIVEEGVRGSIHAAAATVEFVDTSEIARGVEDFTISKVARDYLSLYKDLAGRR